MTLSVIWILISALIAIGALCGQKPLEVCAAEKVDYSDYVRRMNHDIRSCWFAPEDPAGGADRRTFVKFGICKDGSLTGLKIARSSGYPNYDQAALDAVVSAVPILPMPTGNKEAKLNIEFTFDDHDWVKYFPKMAKRGV